MAALSRAAWLSKVMCASASWKRLRLSAIGFPASAVLALVVSGRVMFQLAVVSSRALSASRGRSSSMARTTIGAEPPRPARIALARSTTIRKRGIAARVSPWNFPTPTIENSSSVRVRLGKSWKKPRPAELQSTLASSVRLSSVFTRSEIFPAKRTGTSTRSRRSSARPTPTPIRIRRADRFMV